MAWLLHHALRLEAIMSKRKERVEIGDRFIKTGRPEKIYVVTLLDERKDHPPHARLAPLEGPREEVTIAVSALKDTNFFRRL
jgi:hypothetical protein